MEYNKKKHLNLLKYSQKLRQEGKCIYDESEKDFFELREYTIMMMDHLHWENRMEYFELIEQLLNGPIKFLKLREKYKSINDTTKFLESRLILLEPNVKSEDICDLISDIISLFDRYCPDPEIRESYELSEEELKNVIQKSFIEMKNRYP